MNDADEALPAEWHPDAGARRRRDSRIARRQVIEESSQRRIERDAQDHGTGQGVTSNVVHNVCG